MCEADRRRIMGAVVGEPLVGRAEELGRIATALARTAEPAGAALVLRGAAGMGKSALLARAGDLARERNIRVLSVTGVQAETRLPFAALRQLLDPLGPVALDDAEPPAAGLRALELLSSAGEAGPLCLIVDDAQWIDLQSWEALAFLARRLPDEPLVLLFAVRESDEAAARLAGSGLAETLVGPLAGDAAESLLDLVAADLSPALRSRVLAESGGNPLGLIELAATAGQYAGAGSLPLTARLERTYATVVAALPAAARSLVLVAALDDSEQLGEVLAAGAELTGGPVSPATLQPALSAGLLTTDGVTVRFRHPLIRSAVQQAAGVAERLAAHAALARVLPAESDRSTWHSAAATVRADDRLAHRLAELAARAGRSGAADTAAVAWQRAGELTADPRTRADRLMWAVTAMMKLGDRERAENLLRTLGEHDLDTGQQVRFLWMREAMLGEGWSGKTRHARLLDVVRRLIDQGDDELALDALGMFSLRNWWDPPPPERRTDIVALAERLAIPPDDPRLIRVLAHNAPTERAAEVVARVGERLTAPPSNPDRLFELGDAATSIGDHPAATLLLADAVAGSRLNGHVNTLLAALRSQAWVAAHAGEVRLAVIAGEEAQKLALEMKNFVGAISAKLCLALAEAVRGNDAAAAAHADESERALHSGGRHPFLCVIATARGVALLAAGKPVDAFEQLTRVFDPNDAAYHPYVRLLALAHLAEAGRLADRLPELEPIVDECRALAATAPWPVLTVHLRYATALLAAEPEPAFREALAADLADWPFERARTQLAYGEWLRRHRRPAEARPVLRAALETLTALGVTPWAERARRELRATGETVRAAQDRTAPLTAQELQIAQLAARGLSNQEIARQLYVSPRTVSTHLYRIYPKIGVRSRGGLADALRDS
ncbi:LuxR family transcriptional regulator [Actinoplanes cyaneus]|uniref:LuxR family transcriptional regulator n=1 Tax=Actinoplanes cyaneus TaxID=52696 RepID=A0A919IRX0_9ACTN|nr:regulatory protein, luxR family [Actinoplanes cyaneus]GID69911.1 LuxR family transcriptional regulator [Actinoplanes cyaneus]